MSALEHATPEPPLHKSAQRLRWFVRAFEEQVALTSAETGVEYRTDRVRLAQVFADWLAAFQAQKPTGMDDKAEYVGFAAGLMLRTLIRREPVQVVSVPADADMDRPAHFWPEGYLYVVFCLNVRGLVLEKDYRSTQTVGADFEDTRTWWSFRENVREDPSLAIAFLDLFAGDEPNWSMPDLFRTRGARRIARDVVALKLV